MAVNFQIKLTEEVSGPAKKAASSLFQLDAAIKNEGAALSALQAQMRELKKGGDTSSDTFKKLTGTIAEQRTKVGALKDQMLDAGGLPKAGKDAKVLDGIFKELSGSTGKLGELLGEAGAGGLAAAAAIGAIVIAATAAAGAMAYLASKLISFGVAASEAKGDVTRSLELLYGGEKAAEHTYKVLESLTGDIAISQGRVMELADTLTKAGQVNGDAMVRSIAAIGKAEAARAGAGKVIEGVITRSQQARMFSVSRAELMQVGLSYRDLAKEISKGTGMAVGDAELRLRTGGVQLKAGLNALTSVIDQKMGDIANKKLMTVTVQSNRVHDAFARLFEGVDAGGFARVLNMIANQLSESSVSGAALRSLLTSAFNDMSKAAEAVMPYLQTFFEGAILLALKLYNALYPVRKAIKGLFGDTDSSKGLDGLQDSIINFTTNLAAGFGYAAQAIAYIIDHIKDLKKAVELLIEITPGIGPAFDAARSAINLLTSNLGGKKEDAAKQKGQNVANGLAAGITAGTPAVQAAMAALATNAQKSFDDKMQIHSPSKVMQLRGRYINMGLAKGVNDNADEPARAMDRTAQGVTAAAPSPQSVSPSRGAASGGSGMQITLNIHERAIVVSGGNAQELVASLKDPLTNLFADVLEKAAVMSGALEVKGAA